MLLFPVEQERRYTDVPYTNVPENSYKTAKVAKLTAAAAVNENTPKLLGDQQETYISLLDSIKEKKGKKTLLVGRDRWH